MEVYMDFRNDEILIIIFGLGAIVFTYWFFLMKKEQKVEITDAVEITVEGGYSPEVIVIPKGKKTKITFLRKDPTDCLEEVVLFDFKVRKKLPLGEKVTIEITPKIEGEYQYSCGMNMYHGKIVVK